MTMNHNHDHRHSHHHHHQRDEWETCHHCHGRGQSSCSSCSGQGRTKCLSCNGYGYNTCPTCQGHRQLKSFLQMTVKWVNMTVERMLLSPGFQLSLQDMKASKGPTCITEGYPVSPATQFPPQVNAISEALCNEASHHKQCGLMYMQRQVVKQIPVCKVTADNPPFTFTVHGEAQMVSAPDYPAQSCCGQPVLAFLLVVTIVVGYFLLFFFVTGGNSFTLFANLNEGGSDDEKGNGFLQLM